MNESLMPKKDDRMRIADLGEFYNDRLIIEAFIKDNTLSQEAASLLRAKLMEREAFREKIIAELARKRGISFEQMWTDVLVGRAVKLSPEEFVQLEAMKDQGNVNED